jgi:hypothetical protein
MINSGTAWYRLQLLTFCGQGHRLSNNGLTLLPADALRKCPQAPVVELFFFFGCVLNVIGMTSAFFRTTTLYMPREAGGHKTPTTRHLWRIAIGHSDSIPNASSADIYGKWSVPKIS